MAVPKSSREQEVPLHASPAHPTHEQIAALAFALWHERGCPTGSPDVDWFCAETKLRRSPSGTDSSIGATEDQVNMRATVPPRIDSHGSKVEDLAGTGEQDAPGG